MSRNKKPTKAQNKTTETVATILPVSEKIGWSIAVTVGFFALLLLGVLHHEPWRDEFQALQIVQNSHSIAGIVTNLRYEGHPVAWYFLLYFVSFFSHSYVAMQLLHITLATITAFLVLRFATFPFWMRVVMIFGYFVFYEFAIISRSYVLGELGTVLFCIAWLQWKSKVLSAEDLKPAHYLFILFSLLLLITTSIFNYVEAGAFCIYMLVWCFLERERVLKKINFLYAAGVGLVVLCTALLTYLQIKPLPDNSFPMRYPNGFELERLYFTLAYLLPGYLPLTDFDVIYNWNKWIVFITPEYKFGLGGLALLVSGMFCFQNRRKAFIFFCITNLLLLSLFYYTLVMGMRYNGQFWLMFIASLWIYYDKQEADDKPVLPSLKAASAAVARILFPLLLFIHFGMGIYFYYRDYTNSFSNLTEAGKYIAQPAWKDIPITGIPGYVITPLSYFAHKPVFAVGRRNFSSYMIWDKQGDENGLTFSSFMDIADSLAYQGRHDSLIICIPAQLRGSDGVSAFMDGDVTSRLHLQAMEKFDAPAMVQEEQFYFYLATIRKQGPALPPQ